MDLNRPPKSAIEIAGLPGSGTTDREAYVRANADSFTPETLVHLLRDAAARGNTALFERCAIALTGLVGPGDRRAGGHCEGIILSVAKSRRFHLDPHTLRLYRFRCHEAMWRAVHAGRAKKPFWEERFGRALKQLCIDEARRLARERRRERGDDVEFVELTEEAVSLGQETVHDEVWQRLVEQDLEAAILRLPARQARVAFLTLLERRPVGSADPGSVMNILGVSEREVYFLLGKAKAALALDPEMRKYVEDR